MKDGGQSADLGREMNEGSRKERKKEGETEKGRGMGNLNKHR